jgi:hypothetical protein
MDASKTSAPDKNLPHPFQANPAVPAVYPEGFPLVAEEGRISEHPIDDSCTLCGAPRNERIHVEGKAAADTESPNWG